MVRILVSNDDGINARGIRLLVDAILTLPNVEVFVVAPSGENSGVGHSITYRSALAPKPHPFYELPVQAWEVNGTPADCIKSAYHLVLTDKKKPDLVLSGINVGNNLGRDVYYSGTCSAAREAVILGTPAVALSYDNYFHEEDYGEVVDIIQPLLSHFVQKAKQNELPPEVFWNVNIPHRKQSDIKGIAPAVLSLYHYDDQYHREDEGYWLKRQYKEAKRPDERDDYHLLTSGYITVTPIHIDSTDRGLLDEIAHWPLAGEWTKEEKT
ncbi:5'/3'-nucleotidase SurE [Brevibacillus humidisoli]|uniref:5'/3'-nucleotidase SurE n=1 Tax=Brevibacillus humidisoli TaxID=2895522 RepID=UPI001E63B5D6|nr:5'/3'-nucleotidase SurE [Brevibacillus humidisoli]UFJ43209.1 5'/3'-nucleotidase SurE [Brevibacillus humidisoli]